MSDTIHVTLAFHDPQGTYARHAAVTVVSILENTQNSVCIHILHDETLTFFNRNAFNEIVDNYKQSIQFHDISSLLQKRKSELENLARLGGWSKGALFRLFIPQVLNIDKVIYMDCDTVATMDISELWHKNLNGKSIAVACDLQSLYKLTGKKVTWRQRKIWELWNVKDDEYFNSGVMVFNLNKVRGEYDILKSLVTFLKLNSKFVMAPDQDYLNWLFADDKTLIEEKFNRRRTDGVTSSNCTGYIWHMMWKPWTNYAYPELDDIYWTYLRKTPYCKTEMELLRTALRDLSHSHYMHRHSSACAKRVIAQLCENVFRVHIRCVPRLLYYLIFQPDRSYTASNEKR